MSSLYSRISDLCKEKGVSVTEMCRSSGASRGSLTDLKNGRISGLNIGTLEKISSYFGVSIDYLNCGEGQEKPAPTGDELDKELIEIWNTADRDERRDLLDMARMLKSRRK